MAHHTVRSGYQTLGERLDRFPQGAPPSELVYRILGLLFSEREAALVALLPIKPVTAADAAAAWKIPEAEAKRQLDALADRALLLDVQGSRRQYYVPPPVRRAMASTQLCSRYLENLFRRKPAPTAAASTPMSS